jgi:hypothetical protein
MLSFSNNESRNREKCRFFVQQRINKTKKSYKIPKNDEIIDKLKKKLRQNNTPETYGDVFGSTEHIQYMNLNILALALNFLYDNDNKIPLNFNQAIEPYLNRIEEVSSKSNTDIKRDTIIKLKANIVRYITLYNKLNESS